MNFPLKNIAFALLVVILLMGLAAGKAEAQPRIEITPQQLAISGIIGTSPFQYPFTVRAVNENITELTFSPSNLMEISRGKTWITGANVQITPAVNRIKNGQSQEFIVTVQNIPWSGQYEGTIAVSYKEQAADAQDTLSISVRAANFSANPPQIILRFEKSFCGHGGTSDVPWTLALNEDSGRAPQEMMVTLAANASVSLDSLVHSEDKSQVIRPEQILVQPPTIGPKSAGQGLTIKTNFTNPQVTAGKYTGTLTVRDEGMGILALVPVEVQVRYSHWLALLLLLAGIIASSTVSWLNTTGKKKNAISGDAWELRKKLDSAAITKVCRSQMENLLEDVRKHLDKDDFENAQSKIKKATTDLETCESNKKELKKKADEVEGLIKNRWVEVKRRVKAFVGDEAPVVKNYLPGVKKALEELKTDIEEERYLTVEDSALKEKVDEQNRELNAFDAKPNGLLDCLEDLVEEPSQLEQDYQGEFEQNFMKRITEMLKENFITPIERELGWINQQRDVDEIKNKIKTNFTEFEKVDTLLRALRNYKQQIKDLEDKKLNMSKAKGALEKCENYLASGNIDMARNHLGDIENAIVQALAAQSPIVNESVSKVLSNFNFALGLKDRQDRFINMAKIRDEVLKTECITEGDEIARRAMKDLRDIRVRISSSEAKAAPPPTPPSQQVIAVTHRRVNLHAGPSESYRKVGELDKDAQVSVIGKNQDSKWFQVPLLDKSWLVADSVVASGLENVPFIDAPSRISDLIHKRLDLIHQWWTPKRQGWVISIVLNLMVILILVPIGFSQLYVNNITFGATNVWQEYLEYLALFLWGFGIQTGTAKAADVLKTFRGS
jgi:hypothetical protein